MCYKILSKQLSKRGQIYVENVVSSTILKISYNALCFALKRLI